MCFAGTLTCNLCCSIQCSACHRNLLLGSLSCWKLVHQGNPERQQPRVQSPKLKTEMLVCVCVCDDDDRSESRWCYQVFFIGLEVKKTFKRVINAAFVLKVCLVLRWRPRGAECQSIPGSQPVCLHFIQREISRQPSRFSRNLLLISMVDES